MIWKKRDSCSSVKEVVERNTGISVEKLLNPIKNPIITNLYKCADLILETVKNNVPITIIGDYDADGITASSILFLMLKELGCVPAIRLPKRFSEGYGMNETMIDEINEGLLITVDNGISSINEIRRAKDKGLKVIIIDHHLSEVVPDADVVINPHVVGTDVFKDYCGAGLAYRVSREIIRRMVKIDSGKTEYYGALLKTLCGLAAIGTVSDVVPLMGDNRNIVLNGISAINEGFVPKGLHSLLENLKISSADEDAIGYTLGPTINAAGRLHDDGADKVFTLLTSEADEEKLKELSLELIAINNERKELVNSTVETANSFLNDVDIESTPAFVFNIENINEGIVGIIAGKLAERFKRPCIIFTSSKDSDILKGSGRSPEGTNLKTLLDKSADLLIKYGGHAGAAGLSILRENLAAFKDAFISDAGSYFTKGASDISYYDLDITPDMVDDVFEEIQKYKPYGEGNSPITVKVSDFSLKDFFGNKYKAIGAGHIKLFGEFNEAIGFNLYDVFMDIKEQNSFNLIASIVENTYKDKTTVQLRIIDFV